MVGLLEWLLSYKHRIWALLVLGRGMWRGLASAGQIL
jgi:hypothetical protein